MALLALSLTSCVEERSNLSSRIYIEEIQPTSLSAGGTVSIIGGGFGIEGDHDQVYLSGRALEVLYWTQQRIDCRLPTDLSGSRFITVQSDAYISESFEVYIHETRSTPTDDEKEE